MSDSAVLADYVVVRALEDGVAFSGITRGKETKIYHTERLSKDEVILAQFTEHTSAIKVRGKALILTKHGQINLATETE